MGVLDRRNEIYDKKGQHISITYNPVGGNKLPFLVKFPRLTSYFRRMDPNSIYRLHSEGLFNGLFYIPEKFEEGKLPIGITRSSTRYNTLDNQGRQYDFVNRVKGSLKYMTVRDAYKRINEKILVSNVGTPDMKAAGQSTNFRTDDELAAAGKYLILNFICLCNNVRKKCIRIFYTYKYENFN